MRAIPANRDFVKPCKRWGMMWLDSPADNGHEGFSHWRNGHGSLTDDSARGFGCVDPRRL